MITILVIATNKYIEFVPPLIESIQSHFLKGCEKQVVLFTNMDYERKDAYIIPIQHKPWPYMTLNRYFIFDMFKDYYKHSDCIFYIDADMLVVNDVGEEILGSGITAITHPYSPSRNISNTYETNKLSTAYVEDTSLINPYCCGGFQGGGAEAYLKMCKVLRDNIIKDAENGIIARWHDETHFNKYLTENRPTILLSRDYCTPESEWKSNPSDNIKVLALDKNHKDYR